MARIALRDKPGQAARAAPPSYVTPMPTATMTIDAFEASLTAEEPPPGCGAPLSGLWWARREDWDAAHRLVQDEAGADAAWVHAWLHRVEGDAGNAGYWYCRAGRPAVRGSLDAEWRAIAEAQLARGATQ